MKKEGIAQIFSELDINNVSIDDEWVNASCPFAPFKKEHNYGNDNKPSFGAIGKSGAVSLFHCYTCGERGNLTQLVSKLAQHRNLDYKRLLVKTIKYETEKEFPEWESLRIDSKQKKVNALSESHLDKYPSVFLFNEAKRYLVKRAIKGFAAKLLDLRYDESEKRILFPIRGVDGYLYGFSGRTILSKGDYPFVNFPKVRDYHGLPKGSLILGSHLWEKGKPVLIHEGLMGQAYLLQIGASDYFNVGASMGAMLSDTQASELIKFREKVYFLYDNDLAGDKALFGNVKDGNHKGGGAVDKLVKSLPVYVPDWPEGKYDPDELNLEDIKKIRYNTPLHS